MSRFSLSFLRYLFSNAGHNGRYYGEGDHYGSHGNHGFLNLLTTLIKSCAGKLRQHKRLLILILICLLVASSIFLVFAAWLVMKLIGFAGPFLADIEKNGLKSIVEAVINIVTRIWDGTGK
ncbi:MAG: hypothetical protein EG828_04160 [Deltaproteobacteria bacterium]|nr:hypothetical protein [Deltaproteobacteria bacterium]